MRDIPRAWWLGLPVVCLLVSVAVAVVDPQFYTLHMRKHEIGWLEHGTVLCLVPAVLLGFYVLYRRRELPSPWLKWWVFLITLGALYFGGEEASWGQNYFHWATPEAWRQINYQRETNLHNTNGWLNHLPRGVLTTASAACVVLTLVFARWRKGWNPRTHAWSWVLPTAAVVPSAAIAFLSGVPQKMWGLYKVRAENPLIPSWFDEMFLGGRHNELKEFFLAMFILMYLASMAYRLHALSKETTQVHTPRRAAA